MDTKVEQKTEQTKKLQEEAKNFLLKMVELKKSAWGFNADKNPYEYFHTKMCAAVFELYKIDSRDQSPKEFIDWWTVFENYENMLKELLGCVANEDVLKRLPKGKKNNLPILLLNLIEFFSNINEYHLDTIEAFLNIYQIEERLTTEKCRDVIEKIVEDYDFSNRNEYKYIAFWDRYTTPPQEELARIEQRYKEMNCPTVKDVFNDEQ